MICCNSNGCGGFIWDTCGFQSHLWTYGCTVLAMLSTIEAKNPSRDARANFNSVSSPYIMIQWLTKLHAIFWFTDYLFRREVSCDHHWCNCLLGVKHVLIEWHSPFTQIVKCISHWRVYSDWHIASTTTLPSWYIPYLLSLQECEH